MNCMNCIHSGNNQTESLLPNYLSGKNVSNLSLADLPVNLNWDLSRLCVLKAVEAEVPLCQLICIIFSGVIFLFVFSGANVFTTHCASGVLLLLIHSER